MQHTKHPNIEIHIRIRSSLISGEQVGSVRHHFGTK